MTTPLYELTQRHARVAPRRLAAHNSWDGLCVIRDHEEPSYAS
jgi:hypothetical protein